MLGLSAMLGGVFALVAWLILRPQTRYRKRAALVGAMLPPLFAFYLVICGIAISAMVPGQSGIIFGDIYEPLPNGYVLTALGKMPDYANIEPASNGSFHPLIVSGYVGEVAVSGPMVYGAYSHRFNEVTPPSPTGIGFFAFDTRTGKVRDFDTLAQLNDFAGRSIELKDTVAFRSEERSHKLLVRNERLVVLLPPIIVTVIFFALLFLLRRDAATVLGPVRQ